MPKLVDLEPMDVFGKGVKSFRIVPTKSEDEPVAVRSIIAPTEKTNQLGQALREQQQRARDNRKR